jgi:ABC-2 type transport system ATP-binding protein
MIEIRNLTKRYGDATAVSELDFTVEPGIVTGFLGPNGAGKSTTMRLILGLDAPSDGEALVDGKRYAELAAPLTEVGSLLEARATHSGRTGRAHLLALAQTHGISRRRVDELLEQVGLAQAANRRVGEYSLGMGQRLGIAAALLGDPAVLLLDEPVNGLDPDGVRWIRTLLRELAGEGRTVFLSSHLMSEMAQTADHVVVIRRGRLLADLDVDELTRRYTSERVLVRSPEAGTLVQLLAGEGVTAEAGEDGLVEIRGRSAEEIGDKAASYGIALHELTPEQASLEDAFMQLTHDGAEHDASPTHTDIEGALAA